MYHVRISAHLLEAMTLAAIEAYCYGEKPGRKWRPVETLGYTWGFRKAETDETFLFLDRMSLSISSLRARKSVEPNPEAQKLKNEVVTRWSPHLTMLGDWHTHPYRNLTELKDQNGFDFSPEDFGHFLSDDLIWEQSGSNPVMLVIAICRMDRVRENAGRRPRSNVCHYAVGQFGFWINVVVGFVDAAGRRHHTGNRNSKATLDIDLWPYNAARDRVHTE
jgi:hypothetical protein